MEYNNETIFFAFGNLIENILFNTNTYNRYNIIFIRKNDFLLYTCNILFLANKYICFRYDLNYYMFSPSVETNSSRENVANKTVQRTAIYLCKK